MLNNNYSDLLYKINQGIDELRLSYKKKWSYYDIKRPIWKWLLIGFMCFVIGWLLLYYASNWANSYKDSFIFSWWFTWLILVLSMLIGIPLNYYTEKNNFKINSYKKFIKNKDMFLVNSKDIFKFFLINNLIKKNFRHYEYRSLGGVFFDKSILYKSDTFSITTEKIHTFKQNWIIDSIINDCIVSKIQFIKKHNINLEVNYIPKKWTDIYDLDLVSNSGYINDEIKKNIKEFISNNWNKKAYYILFRDDFILIKYDKLKSLKNSFLFKRREEEQYCELIFVKEFINSIEYLIKF